MWRGWMTAVCRGQETSRCQFVQEGCKPLIHLQVSMSCLREEAQLWNFGGRWKITFLKLRCLRVFLLSRPTFCYSALPHWSFVTGESLAQFPRLLPKGVSFSLSKKADMVDLMCSQPAVLRRRMHIPRFCPCPSRCLLSGPGGQALKMDTKGGPLTQLRQRCQF